MMHVKYFIKTTCYILQQLTMAAMTGLFSVCNIFIRALKGIGSDVTANGVFLVYGSVALTVHSKHGKLGRCRLEAPGI